jgi:GNAT superfamily N-acetyltransferase
METNELRLCMHSEHLDDDWRTLYNEAFPLLEREPEDKLSRLIASQRLMYHRTEDKDGQLLCFTMISIAPDHSLLAFMATDKNRRGGGYGSKHLTRVIELFKEQYPHHLGMFIEIEAVNPHSKVLTDEERQINQRRRDFYLRHGALRVCPNAIYLTPNPGAAVAVADQDNNDWEGELLFVPFGDSKKITKTALLARVIEMYQRFYCLSADNGLLVRGISRFQECKAADCAKQGNACCVHNDASMDNQPFTIAALADAECAPFNTVPSTAAQISAPELRDSASHTCHCCENSDAGLKTQLLSWLKWFFSPVTRLFSRLVSH